MLSAKIAALFFTDFYAAHLPRRGPHIASHSVCLSVRPVIVLPSVTSFRQPLASRMYITARTEGRISYGHLGRTNSCFIIIVIALITPHLLSGALSMQ